MNYLLILGPLALVVGLYAVKTHYYNLGAQEERAIWEQKMAEESSKNQVNSLVLAEMLQASNTNLAEALKKQVVHDSTIKTLVQEKPVYQQCLVDKEIIAAQNLLKEGK